MNEVLWLSLVILVMANGMAFVVGGKVAAMRLNRWIGRMLWRITCRAIGRFFSWLGRTISRWGR